MSRPGTPASFAAALLLLVALSIALAPAGAMAVSPPTADIKELTIETGDVVLSGRDAARQLLVTALLKNGGVEDFTRQAKYQSKPAGVVAIDATGYMTPLAEGTAEVFAIHFDHVAKVKVEVTHLIEDVPVDLNNQVVPLFTKFGCNGGGCHGKSEGQNGFKLSLLGFEPEEDYEFLVRESRGRRLFPAAPDRSLLLTKAAGVVPHGGGKRFDVDSPPYRVLRRWIEQGAPHIHTDDARVTRIEVLPKQRQLSRKSAQQLAVVAHLADGRQVDVTRMTQFDVNQPELGEVSVTGLVSIGENPGVVTVMTRYQSHVDVFRAIVPLGEKIDRLPPEQNFVDKLVFEQLRLLGLPPSEVCDDATFLRRATIDIAGRLPKVAEAEEFLADSSADKRVRLIDRLLESDDYADYFTMKWAAVLRNRRRSDKEDLAPTAAFHAWIRQRIKSNAPYPELVRGVLTAQGEPVKSPPVIWYREVNEPSAQLEDVSQLFLGQRIQCARCHHHPLEKWSQHDYYGLAAFFTRVNIQAEKAPKKGKKKEDPEIPGEPMRVKFDPGIASAEHPKTGEKILPTGLGGPEMKIAKDADPREKLVEWMADPENPFFARTLANRYWKHFLGRGLVEPEDDMRVTNPATNPALLDALAADFAKSGYDMKRLIRTICTSQVYQLSALPNAHNAEDRQNYSRFLPRRLHAEVLLDAIDEVTLAKTAFKGVPAGTRAVQLPDNMFDSYFLSVFGRPDAASACECERSGDATLSQALQMFNSTEILAKVAGKRTQDLAKDKRPHEERLRDLYLAALSRPPSDAEMTALLAHIEKKDSAVQTAYEDIIWALVNTKEFLFNH